MQILMYVPLQNTLYNGVSAANEAAIRRQKANETDRGHPRFAHARENVENSNEY